MEIKNLTQLKRVIQEKREFIIRAHRLNKFLGEYPTWYKVMDFIRLYLDSRSMKSVVLTGEKEAGLILEKQLNGNFKMENVACIFQKWSIYLTI